MKNNTIDLIMHAILGTLEDYEKIRSQEMTYESLYPAIRARIIDVSSVLEIEYSVCAHVEKCQAYLFPEPANDVLYDLQAYHADYAPHDREHGFSALEGIRMTANLADLLEHYEVGGGTTSDVEIESVHAWMVGLLSGLAKLANVMHVNLSEIVDEYLEMAKEDE